MISMIACACSGGKESKVGIVHNVMRYEPLRPRALSMNWVEPVVQWLNRVRAFCLVFLCYIPVSHPCTCTHARPARLSSGPPAVGMSDDFSAFGSHLSC